MRRASAADDSSLVFHTALSRMSPAGEATSREGIHNAKKAIQQFEREKIGFHVSRLIFVAKFAIDFRQPRCLQDDQRSR
jgi:hypothetical protein